MKSRAKQESLDAAAARDLEQLAASMPFKRIVASLRRDSNDYELLWHYCQMFGLGDMEWLQRVVKTWDGVSPLPAPKSNRRAEEYDKNVWSGSFLPPGQGRKGSDAENPYAYQMHMLKGSPRLAWKRTIYSDPLGDDWFTLKVRITSNLTQEDIASLAGNTLSMANMGRPKSTKPSFRSLAFRALADMSPDCTIYRLAQKLQKQFESQGLLLSNSSAKAHVRAWKQERVK